MFRTQSFWFFLAFSISVAWVPLLQANQGTDSDSSAEADSSETTLPSSEESPSISHDELSDAERIAELNEAIEDSKSQILSLEREFENPESEYEVSEREFRELNNQRDLLGEQLEEAKANSTTSTEQLAELESNYETLSTLWKLAKERFDLAIEDRKTLKEQLATLKHKLTRDEAALVELIEGPTPDADQSDSQNEPKKGSDSNHKSDESIREDRDSRDESDPSTMGQEEQVSEPEEIDEELMEAEEAAEQKEVEAQETQEETKSIEARLKDLQMLIAQEQKELGIAKKKVDLATAAQQDLGAELARVQAEGAHADEMATLRKAIAQAHQRFVRARSEVAEITDRVNDHRSELGNLQSEHIIALREAETKRQEALTMEQHVAELKNPLALRNILQWLIEHGPRLLLILLGMFAVNHGASVLANRSVKLVSKSSMRGSKIERENRAKTLVGVFQNAVSVGVFIAGILMILDELGANITVLLGGVAVVGLAVAFGAQNLIKDYFYGFVMLLENQYMLNDTIRIGGVTGQVERITLRMTVLRDGSGVVHFIPNGTINSVSNETHGWSRAVCDVGVNHTEDLDRVLDILRDISEELTRDPKLGPLLLEKPSEPSMENLSGQIIMLKVAAKTAPNQHGLVKQEWLRRIKKAFAAHRILPPYGTLHSTPRVWNENQAA